MKIITIVKKEFEIRDLGTEALEFILNDNIDENYELSYYDLPAPEKLNILQVIKKQFEQAIEEEIKDVVKDIVKKGQIKIRKMLDN